MGADESRPDPDFSYHFDYNEAEKAVTPSNFLRLSDYTSDGIPGGSFLRNARPRTAT
jgi:hypothetical protein